MSSVSTASVFLLAVAAGSAAAHASNRSVVEYVCSNGYGPQIVVVRGAEDRWDAAQQRWVYDRVLKVVGRSVVPSPYFPYVFRITDNQSMGSSFPGFVGFAIREQRKAISGARLDFHPSMSAHPATFSYYFFAQSALTREQEPFMSSQLTCVDPNDPFSRR